MAAKKQKDLNFIYNFLLIEISQSYLLSLSLREANIRYTLISREFPCEKSLLTRALWLKSLLREQKTKSIPSPWEEIVASSSSNISLSLSLLELLATFEFSSILECEMNPPKKKLSVPKLYKPKNRTFPLLELSPTPLLRTLYSSFPHYIFFISLFAGVTPKYRRKKIRGEQKQLDHFTN